MVGDLEGERAARGDGAEAGEKLGGVFDLGGDGGGAVGPGRVAPQQAVPFFHRRAAAGGVDHDGVDLGALDRLDGGAGEALGFAFAAGVHREGAAAAERGGHDDLAALGPQHAQRRLVDAGKVHPLHAAGEQGDARPPGPLGGGELGQAGGELAGRDGGHEGLERAQPGGQPAHEPEAVGEAAQAGLDVDELQEGGGAQAPRVRKEREEQGAKELIARGAVRAELDLGARLLDERVVLHARGAGRHAGHAAEAAVEVGDGRGGHGGLPRGDRLHQVDASAWRVGLAAPRLVGRAGGQAESAVNAVVDELLVGHASAFERPYRWPGTAAGEAWGARLPPGSHSEKTQHEAVPGRLQGRSRCLPESAPG